MTASRSSSGARHHHVTLAGGGPSGRDTQGRAVFDQARKASPTGSRPKAYRLVHGVPMGSPASSP
ncbi:hypothetical protein ACFQQB_52170 [Nonomuraea rubra]|uniref:hypothetical protein n=1 Tax=Nonomuraea rubra TaxID=46180 RepID=UPI00360A061D